MKKSVLLLMGLFFIGLTKAQVGINTRSPQGILHIDPRGDTSGSLNVSDDVAMNKNGNIGIGTTNPLGKLEIISSTPGAIRISDTSEGSTKVLTSALTGTASWVNIIGSWNASITGGNLPYTAAIGSRKINFTGGSISNSTLGNINIPNGSITVPYNGTYRLTLFGISLMNRGSGYFIAGFYSVRRNGSAIWSPHSLGSTLISSSPYVSYDTFTILNQNDVLTIFSSERDINYANGVSNLTLFIEFVK
ncbi:hypothetical protein [Dysgonomonas sp. GY617]|uniref:hypothetical protein n=1 Tax=Dysgonomonas sp. GY617 TaxID=2780420 RepID=UPI00188415F1|nr:hypothetical protein [Dysgonomonas sp. GY617]MBF0577135.1 hypothetical protein [Dysgonomonas sp. GY617]